MGNAATPDRASEGSVQVSLHIRLSERVPAQHTTSGRLAVESGLVGLGVVVVGLCVEAVVTLLQVERGDLYVVLALLAAALGTTAAGFGHTAGRIAGNRRAMWLIPALALYSMDVVPDTAFPVSSSQHGGVPSLGMLVDIGTVAVLLVVAVRPPGRIGAGLPWVIAGVGVVVGLVLERTGGAQPELGVEVSPLVPVDLAVLIGWCAVSSALVVAGYRANSPPLWRVGLGFGVIAAAHVYRTVSGPFSGPSVLFGGLRLFGVVVVLLGMAQLLRRALNVVLTERFAQQEELRVASIRAEQAARVSVEREHELRNGLAGLAGVTRLLVADDDRTRCARSAAVAELHRLTDLLDRRLAPAPVGLYEASEVVDELVALWRIKGMDLEASVPAGLMAVGRSSTLAQVMTNLLVNCARHAPGAPVRVVACRHGDEIVVQVRNEGFGPEWEVDGPSSRAGDGLGLAISRRLLRDEGGELRVHPVDPRWPGWTVSISLVAAGEARQWPMLPPVPRPAAPPVTR
jgi:two-component system OmpR family sensor kinase